MTQRNLSNFSRRNFIQSAAFGTFGILSGAGQNARAARQPNIIYIMADDLGYGDLGCYGQETIQTPRIDRMASEGMKFTDCYAGSTVCAPSRCCLMTGFHTGHARVRGNKRHPLLPEDVTVAEALKDAGYTTGLSGKWGLGEPDTSGVPNRQGFDQFYGYLNQRRAHNYFPDFLWRNEEREFFNGWPYSHDVVTDDAFRFVRENKDSPFFLYLAYTIPHAFNEGRSQGMQITSDAPYSGRDWPQQEKNRAAMISLMDRDVGRLLDLLKELGIDGDTVVFFTSDNGPHKEGGSSPEFFNSSGPLRGIKRDMYEGGIRVPMIARWPGQIQAGSVSDHVWAFWDFPSTAADLAGSKFPECDGISIKPELLGQAQKKHDHLYWEFHEQKGKQAIRKGDWKAVRFQWKNPIELYNLKADLGETNNVAQSHPDIVKDMERLMKESRVDSEHYPIPI